MGEPLLRPLVFVGGAGKEYRQFPRAVTHEMGYQLHRVQLGKEAAGEKPLSQGPLKGLGIRELRDDFDRDTYRVVYTVKLTNAVYVLHAFKKKSKFGISTPNHDIDVIRQRYLEAVKLDAAVQSTSARDRIR
ncbi:type II toxin-antitoxin system RelE/ParE family toxin [Longimicrobium sp.]|uniref:type II toxin-antitoxin system RelE/ParE family toxin n=1 Tax=Longimicrobium sp. TaxID=2029185 RepID=UPI003B3B496E